jgi:hypothetical protein
VWSGNGGMIEPIVIWDLEDDEDGNYIHIVRDGGVSQDEVLGRRK